MSALRVFRPMVLGGVVLGLTGIVAKQSVAAQLPPPGLVANRDIEVLTRGPVHEAFAQEFNVNPTPGIVVPQQPPQPINEIPPDARPGLDGVQWIPGYWGWDDERQSFLWITGAWRVPPPGQRFIPGYWTPVSSGYQWVQGLWVPVETMELSYVSCPPESREEGPTEPSPGPNFYWVPGAWIAGQDDFHWQPGHWSPAQPDWVWVPQHYMRTPGGCLYVAGYWDFPLPSRGTLFAPVYFTAPVYQQPSYVFSPTYVVDVVPLLVNLWIRPAYGHYYFGDFYGAQYANWGIQPWFFAYQRRGYYDPLLAYYGTTYARSGSNFVQVLQGWNHFYQQNAQLRPPRTWAAQQTFAAQFRSDERARQSLLAQPLSEFANRTDHARRFEHVADDQRQQWQQSSRQLHDLQQQRHRVETSTKPEGTAKVEPTPDAAKIRPPVSREKLQLPKSDAPRIAHQPGNDRRETLPHEPNAPTTVPKTKPDIPEKTAPGAVTPPGQPAPVHPGTPTPPGLPKTPQPPAVPKANPPTVPNAELPRPQEPLPPRIDTPNPQIPALPKNEKPKAEPTPHPTPPLPQPAPQQPQPVPKAPPQPAPKVEPPKVVPPLPKVEKPANPKQERPINPPPEIKPHPQPVPQPPPKVEKPASPPPTPPKEEKKEKGKKP